MKIFFTLVLVLFTALPSIADDEPVPSASTEPKTSQRRAKSRHERRRDKVKYFDNQVEFLKPFTNYEVTTTPTSTSDSISNNSHSEWGLRYTYAPMKKGSYGYVFSAAYITYGGSNSSSLRLEGGGSYTFSKMLYAMAGLNIQKFLDSNTSQVIDLGYGAQGIFGIQVTREFGVKIGFTYTTFMEKEVAVPIVGTVKFKSTLMSPELGLYWAF